MGIPKGITLIVGGGYHGKSTLLNALELGVYNHIADDGREYVITDDTAVKLRAEDGRSIKHTDISHVYQQSAKMVKILSLFILKTPVEVLPRLPIVIEAMETGSSLFLIDEDTSATNFMIRDELMQRVVNRNKEPITPFIERARMLFEQYGISSIIVAGSSGSYFHIADLILQMDQYVPFNITDFAKQEAKPSHCQIMTIWLFLIFRIINVFQNQILHFGRRENARLRHLEKMLYRSTGKRLICATWSSLLTPNRQPRSDTSSSI